MASRETERSTATQEILRILWNPRRSSPHSQDLTTRPYPEPYRSNPCPHPTSRRFILILSFHLRLAFLCFECCYSDKFMYGAVDNTSRTARESKQ
jgi:hypothetical protein